MKVMPRGVTRPIGCCLQDGTEVVVKYPNNPFGNGVLVNELIGACVGDLDKYLLKEELMKIAFLENDKDYGGYP